MKDLQEKIIFIIKGLKQVDEIDLKQPLVSNGFLDSFDVMLLVDKLEEEFSISLSPESIVLENFDSVSSLTALIKNSGGKNE